MPLSAPFISSWYSKWSKAPSNFLQSFYHGEPKVEGEQLVMLTQILASKQTVGYKAGGQNMQVYLVNGQNIRNLRHLIQLVEENKDEFLSFEVGEMGMKIILNVRGVKEEESELLKQHSIASAKVLTELQFIPPTRTEKKKITTLE